MNELGHAQVWWADLEKVRPVVVLTRSSIAQLLSRVLIAPITSTVRGLATEVTVGTDEGVRDGSVANLDNVQLVPVARLLHRAGSIDDRRWPEFCRAMARVMDC
ncbi:MAG: type II toxin-antitoxin system PemK/MazF family toxin [Solirubrobacteraceae bacterium]